ncbi:unnamed protein product [Paramecium pentaurelia]|uniref:Uncharacterized protein n=1 Tax=Paramecium pentaurelia TaxID=43138 RepID=A0A8S1UNU2_9CILI|nr:unnamed protein product [Paramecium pentaurelia]
MLEKQQEREKHDIRGNSVTNHQTDQIVLKGYVDKQHVIYKICKYQYSKWFTIFQLNQSIIEQQIENYSFKLIHFLQIIRQGEINFGGQKQEKVHFLRKGA